MEKIKGAIVLVLLSCSFFTSDSNKIEIPKDKITFANSFDFPVGKPDGNGYYKAQSFGENKHLGEDWNGNGGGNTDLGDPVYACANGYVFFSENIKGGWGNVIRIVHSLDSITQMESLYAHLNTMEVDSGTVVKKGKKIGTIGTANGKYLAHLHFEMRYKVNLPIGGGYSSDTTGYLNPSKFIKDHR